MNYSFIFGLISIVAGLTPEMLKKLSEWSKVPSKANQSKHHAVFNMMKRGGFFDPRDMIWLIRSNLYGPYYMGENFSVK